MPSANVSITSAAVIPGDTARKTLVLQNNSDTPIWYRWGNAVSATPGVNEGLVLRPGGGSTTLSGTLATRAIYAVHAAEEGGTKTLTYDSDNG